MPETLGDLARAVGGRVLGSADFYVTDVTHDSREVESGSLFVAIPGSRVDGHEFIEGLPPGSAACVMTPRDTAVPQLVVADTRLAMGQLANLVHGRPSEHLDVVGVTGTNGKTSVSYLLASILRAAGRRPACIGTTGVVVGSTRRPLPRTTPEASDLHRLLGALRAEGMDSVVLEVSSHALALHRVEGITFAVVGFTNLSHDHLDFHRDMEEYFAAKARLFELCDRRVVNVDDLYGRRLARDHEALRVGEEVRATQTRVGTDSSTFILHVGQVRREVKLPLGGRFMIENALMAAGLAVRLGIGPAVIAAGLAGATTVPGRFEAIRMGQDFAVIVDYAHGPEGVAAAIASAREITPGRVIAVVGAGGDRDREKREPMGRAAAAADVVILTSDNPRSEDPRAIIEDVRVGTSRTSTRVLVEPDRRSGIEQALALAAGGDTVLVLGKGHEAFQEVGGRTVPFDDREVARSILQELLR